MLLFGVSADCSEGNKKIFVYLHLRSGFTSVCVKTGKDFFEFESYSGKKQITVAWDGTQFGTSNSLLLSCAA